MNKLASIAPELESLLETIRSWGSSEPAVLGIAAFGSVGRGDYDIFSDLDLVFIVDHESSKREVANNFATLFETVLSFDLDGKTVLILKDAISVKIEFYTVLESEIKKLVKYFVESHLDRESKFLLVDKKGSLKQLILTWTTPSESDLNYSLRRTANSFIYHYENFHRPFFRGDTYRAFFEYSLAFYKLGTLLAVTHGVKNYLYAPKNLLFNLSPEEVEKLESVAPSMDTLELYRRRKRMFQVFSETVLSTPDLNESLSQDTLQSLQRVIDSKYPHFWQIRDLGYIGGIKKNLLFRGATLSRYSAEECKNWIESVKLRTIVDLREDSEVEKRPYKDEITKSINYVRMPITTKVPISSELDVDRFNQVLNYYKRILNEPTFKHAILRVYQTLADRESFPLLIHCKGGTDRTGIVIAILLYSTGINQDDIIRDYLLSFSHTDRRFIEGMFEALFKEGDIAALNITSELVDQIKRNILSKKSSARE
jgi:protein-tyrosine phosphatase